MKWSLRIKPLPSLLSRISGLLSFLLVITTAPAHAADESGMTATSAKGFFEVTYSPSDIPVPLNEIHQWTIHIETANGSPVENAHISLKGGMPEHNHGLPTVPEIIKAPGSGNYLIQGIRFHMPGAWLITLSIESGSIKDITEINLTL